MRAPCRNGVDPEDRWIGVEVWIRGGSHCGCVAARLSVWRGEGVYASRARTNLNCAQENLTVQRTLCFATCCGPYRDVTRL